jgi:hypothetical protein
MFHAKQVHVKGRPLIRGWEAQARKTYSHNVPIN